MLLGLLDNLQDGGINLCLLILQLFHLFLNRQQAYRPNISQCSLLELLDLTVECIDLEQQPL